jgi:hypothetical protein
MSTMSILRPTARRLLATVVIAAALATVGAAWKSRIDYGTFRFWALPHRIEFCGRQYHRGSSSIEWKPRVVAGSALESSTWHVVGHTLTRKRILVLEPPARPASTCAEVLYVETGDSWFRPYM